MPILTNLDSLVQASVDAIGAENSTELDGRDTANRARSNHTGTQLANTISDLTTRIKTDETTTSLSFNTNTLSYTDEDGTITNIDLSLYLDDTNLARLVSGTLANGILTVTRDDATTFTIDLTDLLDNQVASEVSVTPNGNLTSSNVQLALQELQGDIDIINTVSEVI